MERKLRNILWSSATILLALTLCRFIIRSGSPTFADERKNVMPADIRDLFSTDEAVLNTAIDHILASRKELIDRLIPLVAVENAGKYNPKTRAAAGYLLGQMRAAEAASALAKALAQDPGPDYQFDIDRLTRPYFGAVVEIGRPAVPSLLENIQTTDDAVLREKSLFALSHILGGKRRMIETLRRLAATTDPALKDPAALKAAAAKAGRVNAAIKWAEDHYKTRPGDEEPLY